MTLDDRPPFNMIWSTMERMFSCPSPKRPTCAASLSVSTPHYNDRRIWSADRRKLLGWKKSNEKNACLRNKFIFRSFWRINFDTVFDKLFVNFSELTSVNEICNFNDKKPHKHIWIQKPTIFKMAKSPVRNVRAEKRGNKNWSNMRWFSFQT